MRGLTLLTFSDFEPTFAQYTTLEDNSFKVSFLLNTRSSLIRSTGEESSYEKEKTT